MPTNTLYKIEELHDTLSCVVPNGFKTIIEKDICIASDNDGLHFFRIELMEECEFHMNDKVGNMTHVFHNLELLTRCVDGCGIVKEFNRTRMYLKNNSVKRVLIDRGINYGSFTPLYYIDDGKFNECNLNALALESILNTKYFGGALWIESVKFIRKKAIS